MAPFNTPDNLHHSLSLLLPPPLGGLLAVASALRQRFLHRKNRLEHPFDGITPGYRLHSHLQVVAVPPHRHHHRHLHGCAESPVVRHRLGQIHRGTGR